MKILSSKEKIEAFANKIAWGDVHEDPLQLYKEVSLYLETECTPGDLIQFARDGYINIFICDNNIIVDCVDKLQASVLKQLTIPVCDHCHNTGINK